MECTTDNVLPGPPPTAELFKNKDWYVKPPFADVTVRELPIAIQGMSFYEENNGLETRQFYPASHDLFLNNPDEPPNLDLEVEKADRSVFLFKCTLFICLPRAHNISLSCCYLIAP